MLIWIIVAASGFLFFAHLLSELFTIFFRYGYAAKGEFMQGMVIANYFGIASRIFITAFGVVAAYLVESGRDVATPYIAMICAILLAATAASLVLSAREVGPTGQGWFNFPAIRLEKALDLPKIRPYEAFLFGVQFVVLAAAYGISFKFPKYRLTIVSAVPIVTMLGTLITVVVIEPRYAKIIDKNPSSATAITRMFLRARAVSFLFSSLCLGALLISIVLNSP